MTKEIWINLPVNNVYKSVEFFTKLGFEFNTKHDTGDDSACMLIGKSNTVVMLFKSATFKGFTQAELPDTTKYSEVLFSLEAETKEEVDEFARIAKESGGTVYGEPSEVGGWMYGCGFADLDGHRWNVLYMDMSKAPIEFKK